MDHGRPSLRASCGLREVPGSSKGLQGRARTWGKHRRPAGPPRLPPHSSGKPNIASPLNDTDPGTRAREPHQRESVKWGTLKMGAPDIADSHDLYMARLSSR